MKVKDLIEMAAIGDGMGNKRDYEATHSYDCPQKRTERQKKVKEYENQLKICFDYGTKSESR